MTPKTLAKQIGIGVETLERYIGFILSIQSKPQLLRDKTKYGETFLKLNHPPETEKEE